MIIFRSIQLHCLNEYENIYLMIIRDNFYIFLPEPCLDVWDWDCQTYSWACHESSYAWFKDQCKKTCGVC